MTTGILVISWAVLAGVLIGCGEAIKHSSEVGSMDRRITTFVVDHRSPVLNSLMKATTWAGSWIATLAMAIVVVLFVWRRRLPGLAVVAILAAWFGELFAVTLAKSVVQRPRPPESLWLVQAHGWSFPSGHTANAVVVFATAAALLTTFVRPRAPRTLAWALAALLSALVGFSRVELGVHWTTDVVSSALWTTCWLLIVVGVLRRRWPSSAGHISLRAAKDQGRSPGTTQP